MKVRFLLLLIFSVLLLFVYQSYQAPDQPGMQEVTVEKPGYGGRLIVGSLNEVSVINPVTSFTGLGASLVHIVFDGLVQEDKNFKTEPALAYKWEVSEDNLTWKFYLRKGVLFHDGTELTAEDVKFTYDSIKNLKYGGYYKTFFDSLKKIEVIGPYTIEIVLSKLYAPLMHSLTAGILPKHIYAGKDLRDPKVNERPVGTGSFKVSSFSSSEIVLESHKNYFNGRPYLDGITVKSFKNMKELSNQLIDGTIDAGFNVGIKYLPLLEKVPRLKAYEYLSPTYYIIALNNKGTFKDSRVRLALNYAVNKKELLDTVLKGHGKIAVTTVFPSSAACDKSLPPYRYNPRKALEILNDAGWKDSDHNHVLDKEGEELTLNVIVMEENEFITDELIEKIKISLKEIGVSMKTEKHPRQELFSLLRQKKFEAAFISLTARSDADSNFKFWHSSQIEKGINFTSYRNASVDNYLELGRWSLNNTFRSTFYYHFQREMYNDPPGIFLFWPGISNVFDEKFQGIKMHANWQFDIKDWYLVGAGK